MSDYNNWIFQGNPERFRVDLLQRDRATVPSWTVLPGKNVDAIKPGDRAALWISGKTAGVYGVGIVNGFPYNWMTDDNDYWVNEEDRGVPTIAVPLCTVWLPNPVYRAQLKDNPQFADSLILRMPGGRNPFPVTDEEWNVIVDALPAEDQEWLETIW